jgi:hypothetical protein
VTRLGPPSVDLVCVDRRDGEIVVDGVGSLDLADTPDRATVNLLVRRSITVSRLDIVGALQKDPATAPAGWRDVPLLRFRRVLPFDDGQARIGDIALRLDPELGLCIEAQRRAT